MDRFESDIRYLAMQSDGDLACVQKAYPTDFMTLREESCGFEKFVNCPHGSVSVVWKLLKIQIQKARHPTLRCVFDRLVVKQQIPKSSDQSEQLQ